MRSHIWMAIGLVAGLALGLTAALTQSPALLAFARWLRPFGTLFLNLLSMVVIPLVATALFQGVAGLGDVRRLGRLGARTLGFFGATTIAAIAIGFLVGALFLPFTAVARSTRDAAGRVARRFVVRATCRGADPGRGALHRRADPGEPRASSGRGKSPSPDRLRHDLWHRRGRAPR